MQGNNLPFSKVILSCNKLVVFGNSSGRLLHQVVSDDSCLMRYKIFSSFNLKILVILASAFFVSASTSTGQTLPDTGKLMNAGLKFHLDDDPGHSVLVDSVLPNTPAALSDIKKGDKLIAVNGIASDNSQKNIDKINQLMLIPVNSSIILEVERYEEHKKTKRLTYVLEAKSAPTPIIKKKVYGIGVTLAIDSIFNEGKPGFASQVQIVYAGSPASKAGIQSGDYIIAVDENTINGSRTDVISQLIELLLIDEPKPARLRCLRFENSRYQSFDVNLVRTDISGYIKMNVPVQTNPVQTKPAFPEDDRDGDGINNQDDACPDEAGSYSLNPFENGCPDK